MNDPIALAPLQKRAWFDLIVFVTAVVLYAIALPLLASCFHRTVAEAAVPSLGVFGVLGAWGWGDRICNRRMLDERERFIEQRAMFAGMVLFWQVWVFSCMGIWAVLSYVRHQSVVPVVLLPILAFAGGIVFQVTRAISTLVQYRRGGDDAR